MSAEVKQQLFKIVGSSFENHAHLLIENKKGSSRLDKIKIVDVAISYIEHLENQIVSLNKQVDAYKNKSQIKKCNSEDNQEDQDNQDNEDEGCGSETSKTKSPYSREDEENLCYIKGLFEGSIQLIAYLHSQGINLGANTSTMTTNNNDMNVDRNGEKLITLISQINNLKLLIYEYVHFMARLGKMKSSSEMLDSSNNRMNDATIRLIKKIVTVLISDQDFELNFYKNMLKTLKSRAPRKTILLNSSLDENSSSSSSSNSDEEAFSDDECYSLDETEATPVECKIDDCYSSKPIVVELSPNDREEESKETRIQEISSKGSLKNSSTQGHLEIDDQRNRKNPKKDLIERYDIESTTVASDPSTTPPMHPTNNRLSIDNNSIDNYNCVADLENDATNQKSDLQNQLSCSSNEDETQNKSLAMRKNNYLSVFIMHSSKHFYISGCLEESIFEDKILRDVINNVDFRPKNVQRVNLDVALLPGFTITIPSQPACYQCLNRFSCSSFLDEVDCHITQPENKWFSNKRKLKGYEKIFKSIRYREYKNSKHEKLTNNMLLSYLNKARTSYKPNVSSIIYKNYSKR